MNTLSNVENNTLTKTLTKRNINKTRELLCDITNDERTAYILNSLTKINNRLPEEHISKYKKEALRNKQNKYKKANTQLINKTNNKHNINNINNLCTEEDQTLINRKDTFNSIISSISAIKDQDYHLNSSFTERKKVVSKQKLDYNMEKVKNINPTEELIATLNNVSANEKKPLPKIKNENKPNHENLNKNKIKRFLTKQERQDEEFNRNLNILRYISCKANVKPLELDYIKNNENLMKNTEIIKIMNDNIQKEKKNKKSKSIHSSDQIQTIKFDCEDESISLTSHLNLVKDLYPTTKELPLLSLHPNIKFENESNNKTAFEESKDFNSDSMMVLFNSLLMLICSERNSFISICVLLMLRTSDSAK